MLSCSITSIFFTKSKIYYINEQLFYDIFKLLDERVKIKYGIDGFSELRKEAEINANKIYI